MSPLSNGASQGLSGSRAGELYSRNIEVLDQQGITDMFAAVGQKAGHGICRVHFDISDSFWRFPASRRPAWDIEQRPCRHGRFQFSAMPRAR
jgi:hypothetical protein